MVQSKKTEKSYIPHSCAIDITKTTKILQSQLTLNDPQRPTRDPKQNVAAMLWLQHRQC